MGKALKNAANVQLILSGLTLIAVTALSCFSFLLSDVELMVYGTIAIIAAVINAVVAGYIYTMLNAAENKSRKRCYLLIMLLGIVQFILCLLSCWVLPLIRIVTGG